MVNRQIDGRTDRWTKSLIEMRGGIQKVYWSCIPFYEDYQQTWDAQMILAYPNFIQNKDLDL